MILRHPDPEPTEGNPEPDPAADDAAKQVAALQAQLLEDLP